MKRFIICLLAIAFVFSVMSVTAMAASNQVEVVFSLDQEKDVFYLGEEFTLTCYIKNSGLPIVNLEFEINMSPSFVLDDPGVNTSISGCSTVPAYNPGNHRYVFLHSTGYTESWTAMEMKFHIPESAKDIHVDHYMITASVKAGGPDSVRYSAESNEVNFWVRHSDGDHIWAEPNPEEVTTATCTRAGTTVYHCDEQYCDGTKTEVTSEQLPHKWKDNATFTWNTSSRPYTATAILECTGNPDASAAHATAQQTATVTENIKDATCTKPGTVSYTAKVTINGKEYSETTREEQVDALGHSWAEPKFEWTTPAEGDYTAKATHTCTRCGESETVSVNVTNVTKSAGCEENGSTVYTATATVDGQQFTSERTKSLPPTGHKWPAAGTEDGTNVKFEWTGIDNDSKTTPAATVTIKCLNSGCDRSYDTEGYKTSASVTRDESTYKEPTCEDDGTATFTATAKAGSNTYTSNTQTETYPKLGHLWADPKFDWTSKEGSDHLTEWTVTKASWTCQHEGCTEKTKEVSTSATFTDDPKATYAAPGKRTYTATATLTLDDPAADKIEGGQATFTETQEVTLP